MKTGYKIACLFAIFLLFATGAFSANVNRSFGWITYDICASQCSNPTGWPTYIQSNCVYSPFTPCLPITAGGLSDVKISGNNLCNFYNGGNGSTYKASNCSILAENLPPYPLIQSVNCSTEDWAFGGWPGGGSWYYLATCTECNINWVDTSSCGGCTPTCDQSCTGTKTQQDNCGNTRTVNCTIPATGCPTGQNCVSHTCTLPGCPAGQVNDPVYGCILPCFDSDGGKNLSVKGYGTDNWFTSQQWDSCTNTSTVSELWCSGNILQRSNEACPSGTTCSDGKCISTGGGGSESCDGPCSPAGERDCLNSFTRTYCRNSGTLWCIPCTGANRCRDGYCCYDECTSGQKQCLDNDTVQTCGKYDSDPCREWGNNTDCNPGESCSNGVCSAEPLCTDECETDGISCNGDIVQDCTMGIDGCLDLVETDCSATGKICQNGICVLPTLPNCSITTPSPLSIKIGNSAEIALNHENIGTPENAVAGSANPPCFLKNANSSTATIECGTYESADIFPTKLSLVSPSFPAGLECGEITIDVCEDDCVQGTTQCNANNVETCGNYDSDACLEWGNSTPCTAPKVCQDGQCIASGSPSCGITGTIPMPPEIKTGNSVQILASYSNMGTEPASPDYNPTNPACILVSAAGGSATIACGPYNTVGSYLTTIGLDTTNCSGSATINVCEDLCAVGTAKCVDSSTMQTCGNHDSDICYEWGNNTNCPPGTQCIGNTCQIPNSPIIIQEVSVRNPFYKGVDLEIEKIVILNSGNQRQVFVDARLENSEAIEGIHSAASEKKPTNLAANGTTNIVPPETPSIVKESLNSLPTGSYYLTITAYSDSAGTTRLAEKVLVIGIADNPRPLDVPETNGIGAIAVVLVVLGIVFIAKRKSE